MGTPVRRLLFPKILSPLSRSPTKLAINNQSNTTLSKKCLSGGGTALANFKNLPVVNGFELKVTDYSNKLIINSPNKQLLMNCGVPLTSNLDILGKGAFGTVVSGVYKDSRVAAKIVKARKNNLKEKNALNLDHKNVVKTIEVIHNSNCNYGIVLMEYFNSSRHLQSVIDDWDVDLSLKMIVTYGLDICEGLKYCHDNKLLHLDVKPSNVLLCENRICKLCDFGNSLRVDQCTQENVYVGTVSYSAPELLSGKIPTAKCDVYSLGIVLWQLRYREMPYSNLDRIEVIIYNVVKYKYRPTVLNEDRDEYFSIFSRCWSAEPNERPEILNVICELKSIF
ncbi:hypothetical protein RN001_006828 [Aquatica leii]|uniref:non-specific serine/threonine protein kinase n=1 Tax=Aquatica leii TaxID=1421715 RepID=A0AAN7PE51_9COLE|nr:hypothetical protein RN001_006828 [Aquatica leii]